MTRSALFTKYLWLAERGAKGVFLEGADHDDVLQEARIALWEATASWRPELETPFAAFATEVIRRRLISQIIKACRMKHRMLTWAVRSVDNDQGERCDVIDLIPHPLTTDELVSQLDELRGLVGAILGLTDRERTAILRVIAGLELDGKADDNARQRARRKLREEMAA